MTSEDQTDRIQQLEKRIEELENKQQLSKVSRRGLLGGIAGVAGLGAMSGSGAAASGQVGTANNRVNVFADDIDANSLSGGVKNQGCRVFLSSDQSIGAGSSTKIEFDSKEYDSDNNFDTSTHNWTCPEDGLYAVNLHVRFIGGSNGDKREIFIGSDLNIDPVGKGAVKNTSSTDTDNDITVSSVTRYTSGDIIAAHVFQGNSDDTLGSGANPRRTFLEVAFLGGL